MLQSKEEFLKGAGNNERYKIYVSSDITEVSPNCYNLRSNPTLKHLKKDILKANKSLTKTNIVSMMCHLIIYHSLYASLISQSILLGVL